MKQEKGKEAKDDVLGSQSIITIQETDTSKQPITPKTTDAEAKMQEDDDSVEDADVMDETDDATQPVRRSTVRFLFRQLVVLTSVAATKDAKRHWTLHQCMIVNSLHLMCKKQHEYMDGLFEEFGTTAAGSSQSAPSNAAPSAGSGSRPSAMKPVQFLQPKAPPPISQKEMEFFILVFAC